MYRILPALILIWLAACGFIPPISQEASTPSPNPESPRIVDLTITPEIVQPGQLVSVNVKAVDDQSDVLVYTWSAQHGSITSGPTPGSSNNYTAPDYVVDDILSVTVTDAKGNIAKERKYVRVVTALQATAVIEGTPLPNLPPITEDAQNSIQATPSSESIIDQALPESTATITLTPQASNEGLVIEKIYSNLVDLDTGFSVTSTPSKTEKDNGELEVIVRTPDNKPYINTYVAILSQKLDVNGQAIPGNKIAEFRTNEAGSGIVILPPGDYGIWPTEITGQPWTSLNFYKRVEAGTKTVVTIVPSRISIIIRRADKTLYINSYISVSTQKTDANGDPLYGTKVREGRSLDTGEIVFDLSPGSYAIFLEAALGQDWGMFNNYLPPGSQLTYNLTLGRIRVESRDETGKIVSGFFSRVTLQGRDANGEIVPGAAVSEGKTDATGAFQHDIVPGTYVLVSETGVINEMVVRTGETITIRNSDFPKP